MVKSFEMMYIPYSDESQPLTLILSVMAFFSSPSFWHLKWLMRPALYFIGNKYIRPINSFILYWVNWIFRHCNSSAYHHVLSRPRCIVGRTIMQVGIVFLLLVAFDHATFQRLHMNWQIRIGANSVITLGLCIPQIFILMCLPPVLYKMPPLYMI